MPTRISDETRQRVEKAWPDILARVAAGDRYSDIVAAHGLSYDQMRGYRDTTPEARAEWDSARKDSASALIDRLLDTVSSPDIDPARARVQLDTLKFLIERLDPDRFGPRTRADINLKSVDLTKIITDANARLAGARQPLTLEGESQRVDLQLAQLASVL